MTLHAQLLAELDRHDPHRLLTLGKALRAVVELHAPVTFWRPWANEPAACKTCRDGDGLPVAHPCAEVQAIARELGIEAGEGRG